MIKVVLMSHTADFAGAERMLFELAKFLKESKSYHPIVFLPMTGAASSFAKMCEDEKIDVQMIQPCAWYIYVSRDSRASFAAATLKNANYLADLFRDWDIGLVICNTMTSLAPSIAARMANVPCVLWAHGILDSFLVPVDSGLNSRILYDRLLMYLSDAVVCCSDWTKKYYETICTSPISTINNWSHIADKIEPLEDKNTFICLNTFDHNKGVKTLLKAATLLKDKELSFQIDLYGSGGEEALLREFVSQNELEDIVTFRGRTNDVETVYNNCFCLVQPSCIESFGLTITEAMSYARPVISTHSGGPDFIVKDGETGYLIPVNDEVALAEKMEYLLNHRKVAEDFGKAGQKRFLDLFSPERGKREFLALFNKVLIEKRNKSRQDILMEDLIWHYLEMLSTTVETQSLTPIKPSVLPNLREERLTFSGIISGKRLYGVSCGTEEINSIDIIITSHDPEPMEGELDVRLLQRGRVLSAGKISLSSIPKEQWTTIPLNAYCKSTAGVLTVELSPEYAKNSGRLGVYEDCNRRSLIYKVFNKLGTPLQGRDALIVRMAGHDLNM